MGYAADMPNSRYIVLTRLGDSWILRAAHDDPEAAEAEAFRWRRIYGPERTRIAARGETRRDLPAEPTHPPTRLVAEPVPNLPAIIPAIIDVTPEPANDTAYTLQPRQAAAPRRQKARPAPRRHDKSLGWGETLLRALMLYFAYSLANRLIDLAILIQAA